MKPGSNFERFQLKIPGVGLKTRRRSFAKTLQRIFNQFYKPCLGKNIVALTDLASLKNALTHAFNKLPFLQMGILLDLAKTPNPQFLEICALYR